MLNICLNNLDFYYHYSITILLYKLRKSARALKKMKIYTSVYLPWTSWCHSRYLNITSRFVNNCSVNILFENLRKIKTVLDSFLNKRIQNTKHNYFNEPRLLSNKIYFNVRTFNLFCKLIIEKEPLFKNHKLYFSFIEFL